MLSSKKRFIFFLVFLIIIFLIGLVFANLKTPKVSLKIKTDNLRNCQNIPNLPNNSLRLVTKIIDGDTFLIQGGYSVRILGMDADERGEPCYQKAKDFLKNLILNKKVRLEKGNQDKDQWCRYLRYVFLNNKNIALEMVSSGIAVARFSKKYNQEIALAEKDAQKNNIGCKWKKTNKKTNYTWRNLLPKKGLKLVQACQTNKYIGKKVIIEGMVAEVFVSKNGNVFLNFSKPYPDQCFSVVIFKELAEKFDKNIENRYYRRKVRILGIVKEYHNRPEIVLTDPSQIEIAK